MPNLRIILSNQVVNEKIGGHAAAAHAEADTCAEHLHHTPRDCDNIVLAGL